MIVEIPAEIVERLRAHGDVARQVVDAATVWSHLTPAERREVQFLAMQVVTRRAR